jgi:uncharacterized repeat protein (TIGR02543 family)
MYPNGGCGVSTKTESVTDGTVIFSTPSSVIRGSLIYFPAEQKLAFVPIGGSRELTLPSNSYQTTSTQPADFCNGSRTRPGLTFGSIGGPRLTNTPQGDFRLPVEVNGLTLRVQGTYEFFATGGAAGGGSNLLPIGNYGNFHTLYESGANTNVSNREVITVDLRGSLGVELTVATEGTGEGTATSSPPGIDCGIVCRANYEVGTDVTLTPTPAQGSRFVRWDGACTGSLGCVVTMDQNKSVIAVFEETPVPQPGTIQGFKVNDLNDNNLADAGEPLLPGWTIRIYQDSNSNDQLDQEEITTVQETVTGQDGVYQIPLPAGDYLICEARQAGWQQSSPDNAPGVGGPTICQTDPAVYPAGYALTLQPDQIVDRNFFNHQPLPSQPYRLSVSKSGKGSGLVDSAPTGIDCGPTCSALFSSGTIVVVTATPHMGSVFAGWSGACSGASVTCAVTMSQAQSVTARFDKSRSYWLKIGKKGRGTGTVGSSPAGVDCGSTCAVTYLAGTVVQLSATPAPGSTFAGWSGSCSGLTTTCTVTMTQARSVTAKFNPAKLPTVPDPGGP